MTDAIADAAAATDVDLRTTYMGLQLRTPLVASPGPLTGRLETLEQLEEQGVAAVVLPSLFEEQVTHEEIEADLLFDRGADANPEATSYFPYLVGYETVGERSIRHARDAAATLSIPVIASLNGNTPGGWVHYAQLFADAGVAGLELNLYDVVADLDTTAEQVEAAQLRLVEQVRTEVGLPLAVKIGPYYSALPSMARRLVDAGADALVLFNRFYQPDIDPLRREVVASLHLSTPEELRLPLRWTAILSGRVDCSFAVTTGVHTAADAGRAILAGADVVMMTSALLREGPGHVASVEADLADWVAQLDCTSVGQLRGSVSQRTVPDPTAFERANYIDALVHWANTFHDAHGTGPR